MTNYVVMRAYVNPDGLMSHVYADSVSDTREQAIGDAATRFSVILASSPDGCSFDRSDSVFRIIDKNGEVRFWVEKAERLDPSVRK